MYIFLTVLIIIVCVLLTLAVLIQNPKGGGLGAGFGNIGNQVMGARRASDFIEKATWTLVVVLLCFSLLSAMFVPERVEVVEGTNKTELEKQIENNPSTSPSINLPPGLDNTGTPGGDNGAPAPNEDGGNQ